jgi:GH25 family lysozyme M1 (1,4-beta-N-acetylmuramidase)
MLYTYIKCRKEHNIYSNVGGQLMGLFDKLKTKWYKIIDRLRINILARDKFVLTTLFILVIFSGITLGTFISKSWAINQNKISAATKYVAAMLYTPTQKPAVTSADNMESVTTEIPIIKDTTDKGSDAQTPDYVPVKELPKVVIDDNTDIFKQIDPEYKKAHKDKESLQVKLELSTLNDNHVITNGVDVSHWQGKINWSAVKEDGIDFAIIKLGGRSVGKKGSCYIDNRFKYNIKNAIKSKIDVGVYFFSQAITEKEAIEEASIVLEYIKDYELTYPIVFDWEEGHSFRSCNANLTAKKVAKIATAFCETIKSKGYEPMLYGNKYSLIGSKAVSLLNNKYKFWLAHYTNSVNKASSYKKPYQLWQYTDHGRVDGINGNVDLNIAYFGYSMQLHLPIKTLITNQDSTLDLLADVSASDTAGKDISKEVIVTINDANDNEISQSTAFSTPGTYNLLYSVTDSTKKTKKEKATLVVRKNPTISLPKDVDEVHGSASLSESETLALLLEGVSAIDNEGNDITSSITVSGYKDVQPGKSCIISYHVKDVASATSTTTTTFCLDDIETSQEP